MKGKGTKPQMDHGGLTKEVELAIGAPVMVSLNISTDLDLANGVRGEVEDIILDEREQLIVTTETRTFHLRYPPCCVLVKLLRTKAPLLQGLPPKVLPITPIAKMFSILKDGTKSTVNRTLLHLRTIQR